MSLNGGGLSVNPCIHIWYF